MRSVLRKAGPPRRGAARPASGARRGPRAGDGLRCVGTDVHIFQGDPGAADCPPGTVPGHEFAGVIEAAGEGVTAFGPGDRVCVDPNKLCGECDFCRGGIGHFCEHMTGIGTTADGGFAEYCVVPQSQLYRVADSVLFEQAAMAEPPSRAACTASICARCVPAAAPPSSEAA